MSKLTASERGALKHACVNEDHTEGYFSPSWHGKAAKAKLVAKGWAVIGETGWPMLTQKALDMRVELGFDTTKDD